MCVTMVEAKWLLFAVIFMFTTDACPTNTTRFKNMCYHLEASPKTWLGANDECKLRFGQLATIDSVQVNDFINVMYRKSSNSNIWLGLKRCKNDWCYSDGKTRVVYEEWSNGEPNNSGGNENCVEMRHNGKWNDVACEQNKPSICGISAVPLMTTSSNTKRSFMKPSEDQSPNTNSSTMFTCTALFIFLPMILLGLIIVIILLVRKNRTSDKNPSRQGSDREMGERQNQLTFTVVDAYTDLHRNREPESIYRSLDLYDNPGEHYAVGSHINCMNEPEVTAPRVPEQQRRDSSYVIPPPSHDYDT